MSDSDTSDTWSGSVESYFSDSSSDHCPRPRRLMDLIAAKLKLMKCVNREKDQSSASTSLRVEDHNRYLHPNRLASLLKEKLERLDVVDQPTRPARRVTFPDLSAISGTSSSSTNIDVHVASSSGAALFPSPSSNGDENQLQKDYLAKMMFTENEKSVFVLNFPECNVIFDSVTKKEVVGNEQTTSADENAGGTNNDTACTLNKKNGEVRVYDTGRVTISFGEKVFEMAKAARPDYPQEVVCIEKNEATQNNAMTSIGMVEEYVDVLPVMDEELDAVQEYMEYIKQGEDADRAKKNN